MSHFPLLDETGAQVDVRATWIAPGGQKPANYTFLARRAFTLSSLPQNAVLRVSADSRYSLTLNGEWVGSGPVRGSEKRTFFDSYEVAAALRRGENHVAVEVHCPVQPVTMMAPPVTPALWLEIPGLVATDSSWQVRPDPARLHDSRLYNHHIGYADHRDLRRELTGWQTFADPGPGWEAAVVVASAHDLGGRRLVPRDIPALTDTAYRPARVVACGAVPPHAANIELDLEFANLLEREAHLAAAPARFADADAVCTGGAVRVQPDAGGLGAFLLLDFGREVYGNLVLELEGPAGTIVDVGYDEVADGDRIHPVQINPNRSVYRYADRYVLRGGRQRVENRLQDRGFRVLQLTLRRFAEPVTVHGVAVVNRIYASPVTASFSCDDEFLNRLWEKGIHAVVSCCSDLFVDCPWREQTLWIDDQPFENLYYLELTCDPVFTARNLRIGAEGALPDGLIPARYPSAAPMYFRSMSALWTLILADYHLYTGDLRLVRELLPAMDRALSVYDTWRGPDGLVPYRDGEWNFIDWAYDLHGISLGGKAAALNLIIAAACQRAAGLHRAVGNDARAEHLAALAERTAAAVCRQFWLAGEGCFYDSTAPADGRRTVSQIPHAMGLHFGLLKPDLVAAALQALLAPQTIRAELGFQVFVLRALAEHGWAPQALEAMRELWGPAIAADSPALWEVHSGRAAMVRGFTVAASLCHGYAAAPIDFLQRVVLGVQPLQAGFGEFTLRPQSLGLRRACGEVPTPHGSIRVEWSQQAGSLQVEVTVPAETTAVLADGRRLAAGSHRLTLREGG